MQIEWLRFFGDEQELRELMTKIDVHPGGMAIMVPKGLFCWVYISGVTCGAANILKQEILAVGGEGAVGREVANCLAKKTDVLVMGTVRQTVSLADKLLLQHGGLAELGKELRQRIEQGLKSE